MDVFATIPWPSQRRVKGEEARMVKTVTLTGDIAADRELHVMMAPFMSGPMRMNKSTKPKKLGRTLRWAS